jgi:hypothetical protein
VERDARAGLLSVTILGFGANAWGDTLDGDLDHLYDLGSFWQDF